MVCRDRKFGLARHCEVLGRVDASLEASRLLISICVTTAVILVAVQNRVDRVLELLVAGVSFPEAQDGCPLVAKTYKLGDQLRAAPQCQLVDL